MYCRVPRCHKEVPDGIWCERHRAAAEALARTPGLHGKTFRFTQMLMRLGMG